jgi:hypothetical protein
MIMGQNCLPLHVSIPWGNLFYKLKLFVYLGWREDLVNDFIVINIKYGSTRWKWTHIYCPVNMFLRNMCIWLSGQLFYFVALFDIGLYLTVHKSFVSISLNISVVARFISAFISAQININSDKNITQWLLFSFHTTISW